jgi:hypothetical protein
MKHVASGDTEPIVIGVVKIWKSVVMRRSDESEGQKAVVRWERVMYARCFAVSSNAEE